MPQRRRRGSPAPSRHGRLRWAGRGADVGLVSAPRLLVVHRSSRIGAALASELFRAAPERLRSLEIPAGGDAATRRESLEIADRLSDAIATWDDATGSGLVLILDASLDVAAVLGFAREATAGLPVVSTPSIGGRDRYFVGPHIRIADETPDAVAAAVEDLRGRAFNRLAIRENVGQLMAFDRHNFMLTVNKLVERTFGVKDRFASFAPFERFPERWRPVNEIEAGFDTAP